MRTQKSLNIKLDAEKLVFRLCGWTDSEMSNHLWRKGSINCPRKRACSNL